MFLVQDLELVVVLHKRFLLLVLQPVLAHVQIFVRPIQLFAHAALLLAVRGLLLLGNQRSVLLLWVASVQVVERQLIFLLKLPLVLFAKLSGQGENGSVRRNEQD